MAETVHLYLKANGADIEGESTQLSMGRENSIECLFFESGVATAREAGSGRASGKREHLPLLIRKRIDKSTPLLAQAICRNEKIEATFKFFRPNPLGDGTTEQFFTIKISDARIASQKFEVPNTIRPATSTEPPLETITFNTANITWTFEEGGIEYEDKWEGMGQL